MKKGVIFGAVLALVLALAVGVYAQSPSVFGHTPDDIDFNAAIPNITVGKICLGQDGCRVTWPVGGAGGGGESVWKLSGDNAYYTDGNVGIGTSSPASAGLEVIRNDGVTAGEHIVITAGRNVSGNKLLIGYRADGATVTSSFIRSGGVAGQGITLANNGNVGIGIASPITTLAVVAGADTWSGSFYGTAAGPQVKLGTYGGVASIGANNADGSQWANLAINPGGNVGIGTTNPATKLHVAGAVKADELHSPVVRYDTPINFLTGGGAAQSIKVGGILVATSYNAAAPAPGDVKVQGTLVAGEVCAGTKCLGNFNVAPEVSLYNTGRGDIGGVVAWGKVNLGGTDYAIPLYGISYGVKSVFIPGSTFTDGLGSHVIPSTVLGINGYDDLGKLDYNGLCAAFGYPKGGTGNFVCVSIGTGQTAQFRHNGGWGVSNALYGETWCVGRQAMRTIECKV